MPNISYKGCETEISKHVGDFVIRAWHMSNDECDFWTLISLHDFLMSDLFRSALCNREYLIREWFLTNFGE